MARGPTGLYPKRNTAARAAVFRITKMYMLFCSAYSVPLENSYVVLERHRVTLSGFRAPFRGECHPSIPKDDRHAVPFGQQLFQLDMFHEQLPLPVPCYDLVLVTEFAVVLREADLRAPPAPLT